MSNAPTRDSPADRPPRQKRRVLRSFQLFAAIDWSPDGSLLVTAGHNSFVTIRGAKDLSIVNELEAPERVSQVRFSPTGTRLLFSEMRPPFAKGEAPSPETGHVEIWAVP